MTARKLGGVAFRVVAVYLFVQVLATVPAVIGLLGKLDQLDLVSAKGEFLLSGVVPTVVLAICAVMLFLGSEVLARRFFEPDDSVEPIDRRDVEALAFGVAGIWIFGCSIPGLISCAARMVSILNTVGDAPGHTDLPWRTALGYGTQAVVGILLFLQAGRVARWWSRRIRESGRDA